MLKIFKDKNCSIVEGINILDLANDPKLKPEIMKYPIIIIGTSVIKSVLRGSNRYNIKIVEKNLREFRKERTKLSNVVVKDFEVPKLWIKKTECM